MTTTPQPIQQQAFSFTPPGTFSQGFGFVPTRLRIDNPSSYYLTFPEVPSVGTITPYTFGAVVPWNQTGLSVTIAAANNSGGAPVLPANNAAVTVTDVVVQGVTVGSSLAVGQSFFVPAGGTFTLTYSAAPTLVFVGN